MQMLLPTFGRLMVLGFFTKQVNYLFSKRSIVFVAVFAIKKRLPAASNVNDAWAKESQKTGCYAETTFVINNKLHTSILKSTSILRVENIIKLVV